MNEFVVKYALANYLLTFLPLKRISILEKEISLETSWSPLGDIVLHNVQMYALLFGH